MRTSIEYMHQEPHERRYFALLGVAISVLLHGLQRQPLDAVSLLADSVLSSLSPDS